MQLTRHTDYALRVLIHLAATPSGHATITEIADSYDLSRSHLMKVVHNLGLGGFIHTRRGRGGGFSLARPAKTISIGEVVRHAEPDMRMADCASCAIRAACGLTAILAEATRAFMAVLDHYSLADAARDRAGLAAILAALPSPATPSVSDVACASPRPD